MKTIGYLILFGLFATPIAAAEDALLAQFVGEWVGNGKIRLTSDAEPERIFCRITNTLVNDGTALQQKGRCGVATNTGLVDGLITAIGQHRYEGTLNSLASNGTASLTGIGKPGKLVLTSEFIDTLTGKPAISTTTLTVRREGGYQLDSERVDPDGGATFAESRIIFAR